MTSRLHSSDVARSFGRVSICTADILWLGIMSASLIESYAYRYAGTLLLILALALYVKSEPKPSIDWRGWLCLAWGVYACVRYVLQFALQTDRERNEWPTAFVIDGIGFDQNFCFVRFGIK